jgi:hypothetical protein
MAFSSFVSVIAAFASRNCHTPCQTVAIAMLAGSRAAGQLNEANAEQMRMRAGPDPQPDEERRA